ncbi:MAG: hypothetical protein M1836_001819 [Candelina mexicana]|nr:MAG: hypothetical protein M1836_001819 [Candelina mexicana]
MQTPRILSDSAPPHDDFGLTTRTPEWFMDRQQEEAQADARLYAERLRNRQERIDAGAAGAAVAEQGVADKEMAENLQYEEYEGESTRGEDDFEVMTTTEERRREQEPEIDESETPKIPTLIPRERRRLSLTPEPSVDREPAKVNYPDIDKLFIRLHKVLHRYKHVVDWGNFDSVDKLNRWRQQIFRRKIGNTRAPVVTFSDAENQFLIAEHKRKPMNSWNKITEDFNERFEGTLQPGSKERREPRSTGSIRTQRGRIPEIREILGKDYRPDEFAARAERRRISTAGPTTTGTSGAGPSMTRQERAASRAAPEDNPKDPDNTANEGTTQDEKHDVDEGEDGEVIESPKGKGKGRARDSSPRLRKRQRKS